VGCLGCVERSAPRVAITIEDDSQALDQDVTEPLSSCNAMLKRLGGLMQFEMLSS